MMRGVSSSPASRGWRLPVAGVGFQTQVGVLHAGVDGAVEGGAEETGEAEIGAAHAPLVVERGFVGGHDAAAALDEFADLGALRGGKRGDVGEDQHLELAGVRGIE